MVPVPAPQAPNARAATVANTRHCNKCTVKWCPVAWRGAMGAVLRLKKGLKSQMRPFIGTFSVRSFKVRDEGFVTV